MAKNKKDRKNTTSQTTDKVDARAFGIKLKTAGSIVSLLVLVALVVIVVIVENNHQQPLVGSVTANGGGNAYGVNTAPITMSGKEPVNQPAMPASAASGAAK